MESADRSAGHRLASAAPLLCLMLSGIGLGAGLRQLGGAWSDHCADPVLRARLFGTALLAGGLPAIWLPLLLLRRFVDDAARHATEDARRGRAAFGAMLNAGAFLAGAATWALAPRLVGWVESWRSDVIAWVIAPTDWLRIGAAGPLVLATALLSALTLLMLLSWRGWIRSIWDESPAAPIGLALALLGVAVVGLRDTPTGAGEMGVYLSIGAWCGAAALAVFAAPATARSAGRVPRIAPPPARWETPALAACLALGVAWAGGSGLRMLAEGVVAQASFWMSAAAATGIVVAALAGAALGGARPSLLWPIGWFVAIGVATVGVESRSQAPLILALLAAGAAVACAQRLSGYAHVVGHGPHAVVSAVVVGLGAACLMRAPEGGGRGGVEWAAMDIEPGRGVGGEREHGPSATEEIARVFDEVRPRLAHGVLALDELDLSGEPVDALLFATEGAPLPGAIRLPASCDRARAMRVIRRAWSTVRAGGRVAIALPADDWVEPFIDQFVRRRRHETGSACYVLRVEGEAAANESGVGELADGENANAAAVFLIAGGGVPEWLQARAPRARLTLFPVVSASQFRAVWRELRGNGGR